MIRQYRQGVLLRARGFTMVEIMVVVAIIAILAVMIVPNVTGGDDKARVTRAKNDIRAIGTALDLFRLDYGSYPDSLDELLNPPESNDGFDTQSYLKKINKDPWGNDYFYQSPGAEGPYDLISMGADGQDGGEGVNADITALD